MELPITPQRSSLDTRLYERARDLPDFDPKSFDGHRLAVVHAVVERLKDTPPLLSAAGFDRVWREDVRTLDDFYRLAAQTWDVPAGMV